MANVTIIGNGNMGMALTSVFERGGSTVQVLDVQDGASPVSGDIIVLAVPYAALADIVATRRQQLTGKIVVDITNPVDFQTFDSLVVPAHSSATAELAQMLPGSRVLKAFNTTFAGTLASGTVGENVTTALIAGDDVEAKAALIDAVAASGLKAVDAGSLARARELEAMGFLQISLAVGEKTSWAAGFTLVA